MYKNNSLESNTWNN